MSLQSPVLGMHEDGLVGGNVQSEEPWSLLRCRPFVPLVLGLCNQRSSI